MQPHLFISIWHSVLLIINFSSTKSHLEKPDLDKTQKTPSMCSETPQQIHINHLQKLQSKNKTSKYNRYNYISIHANAQ